jgi:hypothetical protein
MKQSLKSGIPEFDEAVEQFENGEINFVELTSRLWNKAYKIGQTEQCNIVDVVGRSEQFICGAERVHGEERCDKQCGICLEEYGTSK